MLSNAFLGFITATFLFIRVALAGQEVRGFEFLSFYNAYRADVEVTLAAGGEEGGWRFLKKCVPMELDFPGGVLDTSKKGCNFAGFMRSAMENAPTRQTAFDKIHDLWAPTNDEVRDMHKWPPLTDGDHNGARISVRDFFGDPKGPSEPWSDTYSRIGKRLSDLHTLKPDVAKPHLDRFRENLEYARYGRDREAAGFQIDTLKKKLRDIDRTATGMVKTKKAVAKLGWSTGYDRIDKDATCKGFTLGAQKKADAIALTEGFAEKYASGEYGEQNRLHMDVINTQKSLRAAIKKKLQGTAADLCGFP
ncbi:hypothetical protein SPI_08843 [Niveomyces insectorum RCEF 264]|uniref:Uncharacterized protein n=1 Tax=Niveomyces insectorum RCEF 264 TaxID=1081102 RepID=A0A167MP40_9HYPO|nr:hypothetical protein SPI_08843 [Niveomyces insectorum RCEF 264]